LTTELEQKTFEYQPTDENGLPIGGKQVLKYTDPAELPYLLAEQNTLLVRKLREQTKKARLGITDDSARDDAPRFAQIKEFNAKPLTKEQRAQLSREILDEDTFDQAITTVFEATIGGSAEELRTTLRDLQTDNNNLKTIREVEVFQARNPDYIVCDENAQALVSWMRRFNLAPVSENFQDAYDTLKSSGVLVTSTTRVENATYTPPPAPVVEGVTVDNPDGVRTELPAGDVVPLAEAQVLTVVEEHPALRETATPPPASRVPLSLNRNSSSGDSTPVTSSVGDQLTFQHPVTKVIYTGQQAIDNMTSDEYRRRLTQPGFSALVAKIEAETAAKRQQRR